MSSPKTPKTPASRPRTGGRLKEPPPYYQWLYGHDPSRAASPQKPLSPFSSNFPPQPRARSDSAQLSLQSSPTGVGRAAQRCGRKRRLDSEP